MIMFRFRPSDLPLTSHYFVLRSVAEKVVKTEQTFKGNVLKVKSLVTENMKGIMESTTVKVSELPEGATENTVHIHFQKRKNGGGEVKKVEMLEEGKARVTFEDPQGRFYYVDFISMGLFLGL